LATKTLSRGVVLSQSTFHLVGNQTAGMLSTCSLQLPRAYVDHLHGRRPSLFIMLPTIILGA